MNKLNKLFDYIEDSEFKFEVNQAAGLREFKRLIQKNDFFKSLIGLLSEKEETVERLLSRVLDLSTLKTDYRYEHPYDTALATYLLALESIGSNYSVLAANSLMIIPRLWWARKISHEIFTIAKRQTAPSDAFELIQRADVTLCYLKGVTTSVTDLSTMSNLDLPRLKSIVLDDKSKENKLSDSLKLENLEFIISWHSEALQLPYWPKNNTFVNRNSRQSGDELPRQQPQVMIDI